MLARRQFFARRATRNPIPPGIIIEIPYGAKPARPLLKAKNAPDARWWRCLIAVLSCAWLRRLFRMEGQMLETVYGFKNVNSGSSFLPEDDDGYEERFWHEEARMW